MTPTPPTKIAPVFISEKGNLAFSRESDGKIRLVYPNWDDAKVVEPSEVLELRASSQGVEARILPRRQGKR